jgi:hypothetical protein
LGEVRVLRRDFVIRKSGIQEGVKIWEKVF